MGARGTVFKHGHTNGHHLICNEWYPGLVVPISSIVWITNSMQLECAESLMITK